jgi:hypothetical protein
MERPCAPPNSPKNSLDKIFISNILFKDCSESGAEIIGTNAPGKDWPKLTGLHLSKKDQCNPFFSFHLEPFFTNSGKWVGLKQRCCKPLTKTI